MPFPITQTSRPLTIEETNALRVNVLMPTAVIGVIGLVAVIMFALIVLPMWERPLIKWFAGAVGLLMLAMVIAVWMHVRNNLGDLRDGVVQLKSGRLTSKRHTGRSPYTFYATLEGVGEVIVWGADYEKMTEQSSYRVALSPRTRRAWTVEKEEIRG